MDIEKHFNTLLQETERRMAAAAAGMEGKETVATCREMVSYLKAKNRELKAYASPVRSAGTRRKSVISNTTSPP